MNDLPRTAEGFPHLVPTSYTGPITRHLLFHVLPITGNDRWRWNLDRLKERLHWFNGNRVVAIAESPAADSPKEVIEYLDGQADVIVMRNNPQLREALTLVPLLEKVETTNPNEITFYGHTKGVTHPNPESVCHKWAQVMWETCFADVGRIEHLLIDHGTAGPFKRLGQFETHLNHRWHFSGTFFWFRNCFLFARNWRRVDQLFFGSESYPGAHFLPDEGACLFGDNAGDLYDEWYWAQHVWPEYQEWKSSIEPSTLAS